MAKIWKSGDLVKLKSGGPLMTVEYKIENYEDQYSCAWFKDDKKEKESFSADSLEEAGTGNNIN